MKRKFTAILLALCVCVLGVALTGCGNSADSSSGGSSGTETSGAETTSTSADTTTITVGIGNSFFPFCYLDENEDIAGYDYEVMKAVGEKLADKYTFVYTPDAFNNLLVGLDTGAYDIAIHHYGYTEERAENYLYANEPDFYTGPFRIGYLKGRTDITDFDSLDGKTVVTGAGSMAETLILNYLEEHPELDVKVEYADTEEVRYSGLSNGLYDAFIASEYDLDQFSNQYDGFMEYSDYEVPNNDTTGGGTFFVYSKGSEELRDDIDEALVALREDGTLKEISESILGADYTEPNTESSTTESTTSTTESSDTESSAS